MAQHNGFTAFDAREAYRREQRKLAPHLRDLPEQIEAAIADRRDTDTAETFPGGEQRAYNARVFK